jgi:hypothetical protein
MSMWFLLSVFGSMLKWNKASQIFLLRIFFSLFNKLLIHSAFIT